MSQHLVNIPSALENNMCTTLSNAVLQKYPFGQGDCWCCSDLLCLYWLFWLFSLSVFDREVLNPATETVELLTFPFHSVGFASHKVFPFVVFVYLMSWPLYHFESDHFLSIYKAYTETQTWRTCRHQDGKSRWDEWGKVGGMNGETGIDIHTLLFFFRQTYVF